MSTLLPGKPWVTRLSSAGLVYLHYGRDIIASAIGADASPKLVDIIFDMIYEQFVEAVDAIDNGISICDGKPRYVKYSAVNNLFSSGLLSLFCITFVCIMSVCVPFFK